ncbi:MAG: hypothetical protein QOD64_2389 [Verrucomicrobiota bacterium]|jgi:hypothetical protein
MKPIGDNVLESLTITTDEDPQIALLKSESNDSGVACAVVCVAVLTTICAFGCVIAN